MSYIYARSFRVRDYECNSLGHVNNAIYQHYIEQTTVEALADTGYAVGIGAWAIRRISLEYLCPAFAGDTLEVITFVSSWGHKHVRREYHMRRLSDGELVALASATWIYQAVGQPCHLPAELRRTFGVGGPSLLKPYRPSTQALDAGVFRWRHQAKRYELDATQHVNSAVYLNWVEEAGFRAAASAGWPLERMRAANTVPSQFRHDTSYLRPADYGDQIEVISRLCTCVRVQGTWLHDIYRASDGELLVRNYATSAFLDLQGRLAPAPQAMFDALLRGGTSTVPCQPASTTLQ